MSSFDQTGRALNVYVGIFFPGVEGECGDCGKAIKAGDYKCAMLPDSHPAVKNMPEYPISFFKIIQVLEVQMVPHGGVAKRVTEASNALVCMDCAKEYPEMFKAWEGK